LTQPPGLDADYIVQQIGGPHMQIAALIASLRQAEKLSQQRAATLGEQEARIAEQAAEIEALKAEVARLTPAVAEPVPEGPAPTSTDANDTAGRDP